jgi:hypothetical protein
VIGREGATDNDECSGGEVRVAGGSLGTHYYYYFFLGWNKRQLVFYKGYRVYFRKEENRTSFHQYSVTLPG